MFVNWDVFASLPGSPQSNFEMLCRMVIRRHYARYGQFAALANQPGVEFHLKIQQSCALGEAGRWYGWQCRWYDIPPGKPLGTTRRKQIEDAIATTVNALPSLSDWVLWTRHSLTRSDQFWFRDLQTKMQLHLWTTKEVEEHLSGEAEILRKTYFGELRLDDSALEALHNLQVAPIRHRWMTEVHQEVDVERRLRRMLLEGNSWHRLDLVANRLTAETAALADASLQFISFESDAARIAVDSGQKVASILRHVHSAIVKGDLEIVRQEDTSPLFRAFATLSLLLRRLRILNCSIALPITNILADLATARRMIATLEEALGTRLISVLADAGYGKTQLSAQLTSRTPDRPAGILLHGSHLRAGGTLDGLAGRIVIQGVPVATMEALISAVDSAGQRARRRLPIFIDGLNEAEDLRDWKGQLASLNVLLSRYPYVLVVCTLRSAFADRALPHDISRLELSEFDHDRDQVIEKYLSYYKIDASDADLPWDLLSHPLTLRLFCEVTNPTRIDLTGVEAIPNSLTGLFNRYLEQVADRVAELAPRLGLFYAQDVRIAFKRIGSTLWAQRERSLDREELRRLLHDDSRPWEESIVRALEHDGVLIRMPSDTDAGNRVGVSFDALSGHIIADAILSAYSEDTFLKWLKSEHTLRDFGGESHERHTLSYDIFAALAGLLPRRWPQQQLWRLLDGDLKKRALCLAADLEGSLLDSDTVEEIRALIKLNSQESQGVLGRLWNTRRARAHPLNAEFVHTTLSGMDVGERDLLWTEWIRQQTDRVVSDLGRLTRRWQDSARRSDADRLLARWISWLLTSTVRELRDRATLALYWYGRSALSGLFTIASEGLAINDSYVCERLLAASYGVVMANHNADASFRKDLRIYLLALCDAVIGPAASHPTNHWLIRLYIEGIIKFARVHCKEVLPALLVGDKIDFADGPSIDALTKQDQRSQEVNAALIGDFENDTLGRLISNRDMRRESDPDRQAALAHLRGMLWHVGWRSRSFIEIDRRIGSYDHRRNPLAPERYGRKYGLVVTCTGKTVHRKLETLKEKEDRDGEEESVQRGANRRDLEAS